MVMSQQKMLSKQKFEKLTEAALCYQNLMSHCSHSNLQAQQIMIVPSAPCFYFSNARSNAVLAMTHLL